MLDNPRGFFDPMPVLLLSSTPEEVVSTLEGACSSSMLISYECEDESSPFRYPSDPETKNHNWVYEITIGAYACKPSDLPKEPNELEYEQLYRQASLHPSTARELWLFNVRQFLRKHQPKGHLVLNLARHSTGACIVCMRRRGRSYDMTPITPQDLDAMPYTDPLFEPMKLVRKHLFMCSPSISCFRCDSPVRYSLCCPTCQAAHEEIEREHRLELARKKAEIVHSVREYLSSSPYTEPLIAVVAALKLPSRKYELGRNVALRSELNRPLTNMTACHAPDQEISLEDVLESAPAFSLITPDDAVGTWVGLSGEEKPLGTVAPQFDARPFESFDITPGTPLIPNGLTAASQDKQTGYHFELATCSLCGRTYCALTSNEADCVCDECKVPQLERYYLPQVWDAIVEDAESSNGDGRIIFDIPFGGTSWQLEFYATKLSNAYLDYQTNSPIVCDATKEYPFKESSLTLPFYTLSSIIDKTVSSFVAAGYLKRQSNNRMVRKYLTLAKDGGNQLKLDMTKRDILSLLDSGEQSFLDIRRSLSKIPEQTVKDAVIGLLIEGRIYYARGSETYVTDNALFSLTNWVQDCWNSHEHLKAPYESAKRILSSKKAYINAQIDGVTKMKLPLLGRGKAEAERQKRLSDLEEQYNALIGYEKRLSTLSQNPTQEEVVRFIEEMDYLEKQL